MAQDRTNIPPAKIPWDLIRTLITETYGGKIDDTADFQQLSHLVNRFFTAAAFDNGYRLVDDVATVAPDQAVSARPPGLFAPEGTQLAHFLAWVDSLPEREPPTYLGLPAQAEKLLLVGHGQKTIRNLGLIAELLEESEQLATDD